MELKDKISLSKVRLEYAKEALEDSIETLKRERYRNSANRSYYAVFYANFFQSLFYFCFM